MTRRTGPLVALCLALAGAAEASGGEAGAAARPASALRAFGSCTGLVRYARRHALRVNRRFEQRERGRPAPAPAPPGAVPGPGGGEGGGGGGGAAPVFSPGTGTNVQEAGVDEPDIVKSDGRRMFAVTGGVLYALDLTGAAPRLAGTLRLPGEGHELLLAGDRLLVLSSAYAGEGPGGPPPPPGAVEPAGGRARGASSVVVPDLAKLAEVDASDLAAMRIARTYTVRGHVVGARLTGTTARVVVATPSAGPLRPAAIRRSRTPQWRPSALLVDRVSGRRARRALVPCDDVRRPAAFGGLDVLTVLTVALEQGLPPVDSDAVMTAGETVYASTGGLYVATHRWLDPGDELPSSSRTAIHRFDVSRPGATDYAASGSVPGFVLNQFSMSEHDGHLRVATTEEPPWLGDGPQRDSESFVSVLAQRGPLLATVGRVGGLGRTERIEAVRFVGDVGFVVTFRRTDPLYAVDLSDPAAPRVRGELKIPGYSAYLHPVGDGLLLGVGQDADEDGRTLGLQVSLFDVSNLDAPTRLHAWSLPGDTSSEAGHDHRAFLWWAPARLAVVPVTAYDEQTGEPAFLGAVGLRAGREQGLAEVGRVAHGSGDDQSQVRRSLVVGDLLYTVSARGVRASRLDTLADIAFVAF
jgi:hypothetical protein